MLVVIGKDDGLTYILTTIHSQPFLHQFLQHLVDGVLIIHVAEYLVVLYIPFLPSLILKYGIKLLFLIFRTLIVFDAVLQYI